MFNILEATISVVHSSIKNGEFTCRQLIEAYISRINSLDKLGPCINSVITINPKALQIADELDEHFRKFGFIGPLHGIPVLLKDNINTNDMATTAGSLSLAGVIPHTDAFIVKKLKDAGAIILAKVNLHEFAIWGETVSSILGQTFNPYDLSRTPGGSSGGTGAGISANFGIIGIGTDTINSVRSPASACCLTGFRPTVGLVSRSGIVPYSLTQDTAGPITRTVEDAVKVLDVISGYDVDDKITKNADNYKPSSYTKFLNINGLKGKRIGVLNSLFGTDLVHEEVNLVIKQSMEYINNAGATLIEIQEDINTDILVKDVSVHLYDLKKDLNCYLEGLGDICRLNSLEKIIESGKFHKGIEENIKSAQMLDSDSLEYNEHLKQRANIQNKINDILEKYNLHALVYPHQKRLVVKVGETQIERNGVIGSITGFPCCTVPAGFSKPTSEAAIGVPIGIEFLARKWDESTLIEIVYSFEQATKYRKPPHI